MKRSIAAITAAASSGEAEEPRSSSLGRRFTGARRIARRIAPCLASPLALVAVLLIPFLVSTAHADPAGKTTLEETIARGDGVYAPLSPAGGERYVLRRGGSAKAKRGRTAKRRSIVDFAQLTDPQVVDEMSPARVDFADAAGGDIGASWRPQEALGTQVFDQVVRNVNANRTSRVRQGSGKRAKVGFAITTGDMADNQHLNESRWFKTVLDGGTVDPFSGDPITNQCGDVPADRLAKLNADVAARAYTGVADYDDYRDAPQDRFAGFWDPDEAAPTAGPYAAFPRYPGLLEAAQRPFQAAGLDVPWFISRGNHDGLVQGNAPASEDLFRAIATGCLKVFPNAAFDPKRFEGASDDELFASFGDPAFIQQLLAGAQDRRAGHRPPDPLQAGVPEPDRPRLRLHAALASCGAPAAPRATTRSRARACASSRSTPSPRAAARTATSTTPSTAGCAASCARPSAATGSWSSSATTRCAR